MKQNIEINNTSAGAYHVSARGITLITLVITIIVLLILAGVALTLTIGENGIINNAKYATEENSTEDNIVHTGQPIHYSGKYFILSKMISGNESMPSYNTDQTMTGNSRNGYARITPVSFK